MKKILQNIKILAEKEGISINDLERTIGASKGVISRALKNDTDIQAKWLQAIVENFQRISGDWLLTGEGNMYRKPANSTLQNIDNTPINEELIRLRAENDLLRELAGLKKKSDVG